MLFRSLSFILPCPAFYSSDHGNTSKSPDLLEDVDRLLDNHDGSRDPCLAVLNDLIAVKFEVVQAKTSNYTSWPTRLALRSLRSSDAWLPLDAHAVLPRPASDAGRAANTRLSFDALSVSPALTLPSREERRRRQAVQKILPFYVIDGAGSVVVLGDPFN